VDSGFRGFFPLFFFFMSRARARALSVHSITPLLLLHLIPMYCISLSFVTPLKLAHTQLLWLDPDVVTGRALCLRHVVPSLRVESFRAKPLSRA
jgi:hypothetical protein